MILFSPAKLNLFFKVHRKREDGYHEISSLYQAINLGDHLHIGLDKEDVLTCNDPHLSCDSSNLIQKAIHLFRKRAGTDVKVRCHLEKNTPVGGGLGGGSSNAATTLFAMNELTDRSLSFSELRLLSESLGSDVPFFFSHGTALCTGRGEKIEEVKPVPLTHLWVASPSFGISTREVYQRTQVEDKKEDIFFNDLEKAAFSLEPRLQSIKAALEKMFEKVVMTGSGSSFFCIGDVEKPALSGIRFFPVKCITREKEKWYEK